MLDFVEELRFVPCGRKKFWLTPVILMTCVVGGLGVLVEGSAIALFIHTLV
jgi:Family of unknown function (DUF5989)